LSGVSLYLNGEDVYIVCMQSYTIFLECLHVVLDGSHSKKKRIV